MTATMLTTYSLSHCLKISRSFDRLMHKVRKISCLIRQDKVRLELLTFTYFLYPAVQLIITVIRYKGGWGKEGQITVLWIGLNQIHKEGYVLFEH